MFNATSDMEYTAGYKNLNVWQKADELCLLVYKITKNFPKGELFSLTPQIRRCVISIPANIVEGYGRRTQKDKIQFYYIARGSLNELEYYIDLSHKLGYIKNEEYNKLLSLRSDVGRLLNGFIRSLEK